jgi:hypothetical protein
MLHRQNKLPTLGAQLSAAAQTFRVRDIKMGEPPKAGDLKPIAVSLIQLEPDPKNMADRALPDQPLELEEK